LRFLSCESVRIHQEYVIDPLKLSWFSKRTKLP